MNEKNAGNQVVQSSSQQRSKNLKSNHEITTISYHEMIRTTQNERRKIFKKKLSTEIFKTSPYSLT